MEQHPVENGPLRTARTIDARHIGNKESRRIYAKLAFLSKGLPFSLGFGGGFGV
jgi:hypothetical protein